MRSCDVRSSPALRKVLRLIISQVSFGQYENEGNEVFINSMRLHVAFGQRLSEKLRYELHYIAQGSQLLREGGLDVAQNIFRIRVFHTIFNDRQEKPDENE